MQKMNKHVFTENTFLQCVKSKKKKNKSLNYHFNLQSLFLILLTFFLLNNNSFAQSIPAGENISLDQQLSNINLSSVTSGIIYERVLQTANLYNFNKTSSFNTANFRYFKQALHEMNKASNGTKFITTESLKAVLNNTIEENTVDLSILNTQFQILNYNEDNPTAGGLTFNTTTNKFANIVGKVPFYTMHNIVIAPCKEVVSGNKAIYKIRNDLFFQNGTKTIKTLVANFGDGISRNLITNSILTAQNITVNYTTSGEKLSTYFITYSDNSTATTYGKILFKYFISVAERTETNTDLYKESFSITADEPFLDYNGSKNVKGKIDYRIFYHNVVNPSTVLLKPIIIIDGFDPEDKRKIEDSDCANDPTCWSKNSINGVFSAIKHKSFFDLMDYKEQDGTPENLLTKLRKEGYDVILVNQPNYTGINEQNGQQVSIDGGADYIERNALALVSLIKWVNAKLISNGSTSQIAILGPSMGGQISRYALSYMEKKKSLALTKLEQYLWKHNTYLWVSVDSPHLGANIPMGVQSLLNLAKDSNVDAKEFYEKSLASPAAQQQIIEFHGEQPVTVNIGGIPINTTSYHGVDSNKLNAQTTSQNMPLNRGNSFFQQHYNNQNNNGVTNSNGWPVSLRKIALTNGSMTSSKQTIKTDGTAGQNYANDGQQVLNLRGFQRVNIDLPWPLGSITFRTHIASLESMFMPSNGNNGRVCRLKKAFNDKTTQLNNYNIRGVMDNVPGGYFNAQQLVGDGVLANDPVPGQSLSPEEIINWQSSRNITFGNLFKSLSEMLGGSEWYVHAYNPYHTFIPTYSALAIKSPNQNWNNRLDFNLNCGSNNLTPFDSYYGENLNSEHTTFTYKSAEWLMKELRKVPQAPSFPLEANLLTGPNIICENTNTTFSFPDICKIPSAVTWSVTANAQIVSQTAYSVVVKGTSSGSATLTATFQNGQTISKTAWVGVPQPTELLTYSNIPYDSTLMNAPYWNPVWQFKSTNQADLASEYNFKDENGNVFLTKYGYGQFEASASELGIGHGNTKTFYVYPKNDCGELNPLKKTFLRHTVYYPTLCEHGIGAGCHLQRISNLNNWFFKTYPNPTNNIINIELKNSDQKPAKNATIFAELYNMMGEVKRNVTVNNNIATIDVLGLTRGIYILKINIEGIIESHQVAIE